MLSLAIHRMRMLLNRDFLSEWNGNVKPWLSEIK